jgi:hypothetical protein
LIPRSRFKERYKLSELVCLSAVLSYIGRTVVIKEMLEQDSATEYGIDNGVGVRKGRLNTLD